MSLIRKKKKNLLPSGELQDSLELSSSIYGVGLAEGAAVHPQALPLLSNVPLMF